MADREIPGLVRCATCGVVRRSHEPAGHEFAEPDPYEYEEVDHPSHYGGDTPYEVIKVLEAWNEMFGLPVNVTSAMKYLARAGRKPGVSAEKDLRKALWHIQREIDRRWPQ